jgi:glycosyltransferase involved in cell wall biosynthesis
MSHVIQSPLVSVIIPSKNRSRLLKETLRSLSNQTYQDWEAIVVNDASTDDTEEYVLHLSIQDPRFKYILRANQSSGASCCRNLGFSMSRGDYVIFLDSDDLLDPDCIEKRVETMRSQNVGFSVFMTRVFREVPGDDSRVWNTFTEDDDLNRFLSSDMPWSTSGPIWSKRALQQIGPWDEECLSAQDWEFHIRAIASGVPYVKIARIDSSWRDLRFDSITFAWKQSERVLSRAKIVCKIAMILMMNQCWCVNRRKLLLTYYYKNVYSLCIDFKSAYSVWRAGYHAKFVKWHEFIPVIVLEFFYRSIFKLKRLAAKQILDKSPHLSGHLKVFINQGRSAT